MLVQSAELTKTRARGWVTPIQPSPSRGKAYAFARAPALRLNPQNRLCPLAMCNEHRRLVALGRIPEDWSQTRIPLLFPEGLPNLAPLDSIRITDPTVIIRASRERPGAAELVQRRWSWPAPNG